MTKISYVITVNGVEVPTTKTCDYDKVVTAVKTLNEDKGRTVFGFKTILTPYNPEETAETRAQAQEHARKVREAILRKKLAKAMGA